jgi:hypothetical protein
MEKGALAVPPAEHLAELDFFVYFLGQCQKVKIKIKQQMISNRSIQTIFKNLYAVS